MSEKIKKRKRSRTGSAGAKAGFRCRRTAEKEKKTPAQAEKARNRHPAAVRQCNLICKTKKDSAMKKSLQVFFLLHKTACLR